ncbi:MAG: hypothetical protein Q8M08_08815 [Bacteroidales bacterium]|nr:hypothetical protein [Bacteroidales bacterium]
MKITGSGKSFPIFAALLVSSVVFGLFATYHHMSDQPGQHVTSTWAIPSGDTIPSKRSKAQDSVFTALMKTADRYFGQKDYLNAKAAYQMAASQNPTDEVAKEKLRKTLELLRSTKAQNILFDVTVASADKLFQAGEYAKAMQEYENASKILPGEAYPKNKINEIIKLQVDNQVKEEEYGKAIANADKFYLVKNYQVALLDYRKAAGIKPGEKYPQDRIREVTGILEAQKARDDAYIKAVALGDQFFQAVQYPDAIKSYQDALAIKPEQAYPREKIKEIEGIMMRRATAQADYEKYIDLADSLYIAKQYYKARENYMMASSVKPSEAYPRDMVSKADKLLTGQEAAMAQSLEEQYVKTIAGADKLLTEKSYEPARAEYLKASNLKPAEQYPQDKIREIDNIFAMALKDKEEQYKSAISSGDKAFGNKVYELARSEFQAALAIKPNEAYPKSKIAEIDKLVAADAKQKAFDARYANAIGQADSMFIVKAYLAAKSEFQNASNMKPDEVYPKNRIVEINLILYNLEKQKAQIALYKVTVDKADKLLAAKSYAMAKTEYENALALQPEDTYPREKISEIDRILGDLAALKALDEKYAASVAAADKLFAAKTWDQARLGYQNAGSIKPDERYPKEKIAEIDKILADIAAKQSVDENYLAAIAKADNYLTEKNYEPARAEYTNASGLKPNEQYPKTKITEIDAILASIAKQKALEEDYAATILRADKLLTDKSYEPALTAYLGALKLKPAEEYPKEKIREITEILSDIEKQKSLEAQYAGILAKADKMFEDKAYATAKNEYVNAQALKPGETYPREQVAAIDKILADLAAAKALDDKYAGMIVNADKLLAAKTYDQAKLEYLSAGLVKPSETYPKEKIAEIDGILAAIAAAKSLEENYQATIANADKLLTEKSYQPARAEYTKATGLKPAENYPVEKISEIDAVLATIAKQKALDDEYAATIVKADKLLDEKSYEPAKSEYEKALRLKDSEQYPKTKLAEIEKLLADAARLKAIDDQYAAAVAAADKLLLGKIYDQAKTAFLEAGKIKPGEQYPKEKIIEIDNILAAIEKQQMLDEQYKLTLAKADQLLADKTYDQAKVEYLNASGLKPSEQYPKDKIAEIDGVLAELKAKEDAYKATLAAADQFLAQKKYEEARAGYQDALVMKPQATYPKEKIAEINKALEELLGKQKYYENLLANADNYFNDKDYPKAKETYQEALTVFPTQPYPKAQINLITARIDSLYRANRSLYDKAVADGDRSYNSFEYDKAIDAYTEAVNLLPMEKYPREMILKIRTAIKENAIADVLNTPVIINSNNEKQFSFTPVNIASRKNNFIYIKIKNLSGKPFNVLMRYGKDKQANGGVVMRNINPNGKISERLVSVRDQDLWSREDNDWISLYPQGGDVEVSFIQISRAK